MRDSMFIGKSILLGVPSDFQLDIRFEENLKHLGFVVHRMPERVSKVNIPLKDVFIHIVRKLLFKDKTHKLKIKGKLRESNDIEFIKKVGQVDYALFIRADQFSLQTIETVKRFSKKIVAYQWDGIERFPLIKQYVGLFDKFCIFDKNDVGISSSFIPITNFYFDDLQVETQKIFKKSVFFVGTQMKDRIPLLNGISNLLLSNGLVPDFYLFKQKQRKKINDYIQIIPEPFDFKENILKVQRSEYVLDLHNPVHNGLSFRIFESIGYEKKLITNNILVKEFDFYNPDNIYVIENMNFLDLDEFIKKPYVKNEKIRFKYGFTNWIEQILKF